MIALSSSPLIRRVGAVPVVFLLLLTLSAPAARAGAAIQGELSITGVCLVGEDQGAVIMIWAGGVDFVTSATGDLAPFVGETASFSVLPIDPFSPVDDLLTLTDTESGAILTFSIDSLVLEATGGKAAQFRGEGHYNLTGFDETTGTLNFYAGLFACSQDGHTGPAYPPDISLAPSLVEFPPVAIGDDLGMDVTIHNEGELPLEVQSITRCPGTSSEFTWMPKAPFSVPQGDVFFGELTVIYTPVDHGIDPGCLRIATNDPDEGLVEVEVLARTHPPFAGTLVLQNDLDTEAMVPTGGADTTSFSDATGVDFIAGDASITGGTGSFEGLTNGDRVVSLNPYTFAPFSGPLTAFTVDGTLQFVLETAQVDIQTAGELQITGTGHFSQPPFQDTPATYRLSSGSYFPTPQVWGFEIEITTSETSIQDIYIESTGVHFGPKAVGGTRSVDIEVRNLGDIDLILGPITWCRSTSTEFFWDLGTLITVLPMMSRDLTLTFQPFDQGAEDGCLLISSNDPDEDPIELPVSGTGITCAMNDVVLSDVVIDTTDETVGCISITADSNVEILQGTLVAGSHVTLANGTTIHEATVHIDKDLLP